MCLKKMLIVLVILLIYEVCGFENDKICNIICDCEYDLTLRFNRSKASTGITGNRRGLFDKFPKNRYENVTYIPTDYKTHKVVKEHYYEVIFVFSFIGLAAIIQHLITYYKINLSYDAFVLLFSFIAGILSKLHPSFDSFTLLSTIDSNVIIRMFLPSIIIYTVFSVDFYIMTKCFYEIILLGFAGFIIRCTLIGVIMVNIINISSNWETFFIFGTICSITQPKEALRMLKTVGEFKHVSALLEAESLVSLCLGIFVYNVIYFRTSLNQTSIFAITALYYSVLSLFLGVSVGWIAHFLLKWISSEGCGFTYALICFSYFIYAITLFCFSPVTALLGFLWVLQQMKSALSPSENKIFERVIEACGFISNTMIMTMTGIVITETMLVKFYSYRNLDFFGAIATYFVTYMVRFAVLFFLLPILRKVGYDIPWQHMLVITTCGIRGSFSLFLAVKAKETYNFTAYNSTYLLCTTVLVFTSVIINPLCLTIIIEKLHLDRVDDAMANNMTAVIKDVFKRKESELTALKANKEYSETNWNVVENFTRIKHPYPWSAGANLMEKWEQRRISFPCPHCIKDSYYRRTSVEINAEVNKRILQIKKINFRRQYDEGLLNIHELQLLEAVIDNASDTKNKIMNLKSMKDLWAENWFLNKFRRRIFSIVYLSKQKYIQPPLNSFRYKMYKIIKLKYYETAIFVCNFLSLVPVVYNRYCERIEEETLALNIIVFNVIYMIFFFLFLTDCLMKICAMGWRQYIRSWWSGVEVCLLLCSLLDCGIQLHSLATIRHFQQPFLLNEMNFWLKIVRAVYILRIIKLIQLYMPRILTCIDDRILVGKLSGCNIAQCAIKTQEEIVKYTQYLTENEGPSFDVELRETSYKYEVQKDLGSIQSDFPLVSITVKTKHAIQVILNNMKWHLDGLKEKGIIDDIESKIFTHIFKEKHKELNKMCLVPSPLPGVAFKAIPWIADDEAICDYLIECAELLWYQPGDEILFSGGMPQGFFIILSGQATSSYKYSKTAEDNQKYYGLLPNCDFFVHLNFDDSQRHDDILYPGTEFGEIGVLTDRPYNYSVICTSSVMVSFISKENIQKAFNTFKNFEDQMWKSVAIKVAILKFYLPFQKLQIDNIKSKLQNGNMFILRNCLSLELNKFPGYVFLLEGTMEDKANKIIYIAPTYFAETTQILTYFNASVNEDIKSPNEEFENINNLKVDIKIFLLGELNENLNYIAKNVGNGKYSLISDQISLLCEYHKSNIHFRK